MDKKLLINILTHGDELVGKRVVDEISQKYPSLVGNGFDIQVANEEAHAQGKRFIDHDLNRVFPGRADGSVEERRAFEIAPRVSAYDYVIDVHSTESGAKDMVIVTKLDEPTCELLKYISPKYVLHMTMKPDTSLISQAKVGIAFEMGSDKDEETFTKTVKGIERVISSLGLIPETPSFGFETQYYEVFSPISKPKGAVLEGEVQNFKLIKKGEVFARIQGEGIVAEEDFYPVIFGNTNYESIFGFAARLLTIKS